MSEPTGNRWRDPDKVWNPDGTKKPREEWDNPSTLANPKNIQLDTQAPSDAGKRKYGPAVMDKVPDEFGEIDKAQVSIAAAHADRETVQELKEMAQHAEEIAEELPEIGTKLGKGFYDDRGLDEFYKEDEAEPKTRTAVGPHIDGEYEQLIDRIRTLGGKSMKGDAEATAELNMIAEAEYGRDDGGRRNVKARLNSYKIGRPGV